MNQLYHGFAEKENGGVFEVFLHEIVDFLVREVNHKKNEKASAEPGKTWRGREPPRLSAQKVYSVRR